MSGGSGDTQAKSEFKMGFAVGVSGGASGSSSFTVNGMGVSGREFVAMCRARNVDLRMVLKACLGEDMLNAI